MFILRCLLLILCLPGSIQLVFANTDITGPVNDSDLNKVLALLNTPEKHIDFALAKLTIDSIIDPDLDIKYETHRLELMVQAINAMGLITSMEKKNALRTFIYEPGIWNQYHPFSYNFNDPKGTNIKSKLISHYLTNRNGNCISMPFLFIILGQRLGLDVAASTAPLHVFVKYTDDATGVTYNLETTSGGNPARDSWLRQGFPMSQLAVNNGIYLKKLTNKETVAVMANVLLQYYYEQKQFGQLIAMADLILLHYPKAVSAVVYKASAYNELLKVHNLWRYHSSSEVPQQERDKFIYLVSRVNEDHNKAVLMGWRQPSQVENEAYLKKVRQKATK